MALKHAIPTTPDDLRDFLDDPEKIGMVFHDKETAAEFIESYRVGANAADPDLQDGFTEQQQKGLKGFLEDNGYTRQSTNGRHTRVPDDDGGATAGPHLRGRKAIYADSGMTRKQMGQVAASGYGPGVDLAEKWEEGVGEFAQAALKQLFKIENDSRLKDLSETIPGDGGVLVPEEFRADLLFLALEGMVVRPRARVIPMGSATLRYPAIKDTSHASNVFGGVVGTWVAEAGTVSSSTNQPTFSAVRLMANKLTGSSQISNELLMDSAVAIEGLINTLYPQAIAYFEDDAFIAGVGAGQPLGFKNADALISVAKETGQPAATVVWENILNLYSRMLPQALNNAVWIAHNDTFPQLASMSLAVGTGGSAVWLANGVSGPPMTILGRPVIFTEKAETVGTAGDLSFVALDHYLLGDRQAMTMAVSEHSLFATDQREYRFIERVDGRPWVSSALTPRNGSNTVSPYLNIATRA